MRNMLKTLFILFIFFLTSISIQAADVVDKGSDAIEKITDEGKKKLKVLIRKSLKDKEIIEFLSEYVIIINDEKGDGFVTYFFEDKVYKRYKDFKLISEDKWKVSYLDKKLKIYIGENKETWKIQPSKIKNIILIKKKLTSIGKPYAFSYESKTDFHVSLEEKKLKN